MISIPEVLVLHVRTGYDERALHIEKMLGENHISFKYILDGDISDLTDSVLSNYFSGDMCRKQAKTSCAMKHILAYEHIIRNNLDGALILEDDIFFYNNFPIKLGRVLNELKNRNIENALISLEDSNLQFVSGSSRIKGQMLYRAKRDRFTGCYYITKKCAEMLLDYICRNGCHLPIDRYHAYLIDKIGLPYYWSHPVLATQGTHTGLFVSSISEVSKKKRLKRRLTWLLKRTYKCLVYRFR